MTQAASSRRGTLLWLGALLLLSVAVRLIGIDNGLPRAQITDETNEIVTALEIARLQVPDYTYHRVFYPLLQLPVHGAHFIMRALTGGFSLADFEALYFTDRAAFILPARILTALLSALTVIPCFFIGRRLTGHLSGGVLAALLIALHPGLVYHAHYALPDPVSTLWVAALLLTAVWIIDGRRWAYILAGIVSAALILTRLQAAPILLAVPLAHLVRWWQNERSVGGFLLPMIRYGLAFIAANVIFNPFIILAPEVILADFQFLLDTHWRGGGSGGDLLARIAGNAALPLIAVGPILTAFALIGFGFGVVRRSAIACVIGLAGFVSALIILPGGWVRIPYWLPTIVPAALLSAYLLGTLLAGKRRLWRVAAVVGAGIVLAPALLQTTQISSIMTQINTRIVAAEWIEANIPAHTALLIGETFVYGVPLNRDVTSLGRLRDMNRLTPSLAYYDDHPDAIPQPAYDLYGREYTRVISDDDALRAFIAENDIAYVVEADYCGGGLTYDTVTEATFPYLSPAMRDEWEQVFVSSPFVDEMCRQVIPNRTALEGMRLGDWERVGPLVRIYAVPDTR